MPTTAAAQASVNNDWNAMAGEWDDMGAPKEYSDSFMSLLWKQTGLKAAVAAGEKRVVVDFGSGTGLLTENLRNSSESSSSSSSSSSTTTFICIDPASAMAGVVRDKILAGGWSNTRVHSVALANLENADDTVQKDLESLKGTVDLIVASSVMSFVPKDDLPTTMKVLAGLLKKSGGLFCHSDWPKGESAPDGFTADTAKEMYDLGGLSVKSALDTTFKMGSEEAAVFFGVAERL
jgi:SAM-dependent methyltransferase